MNILEFYLNQQKYPEWYSKFQSTAKNKSGKVFNYTSTNYRNILNFLQDLSKFRENNGVSRNEWDKYSKTGQEVDKQRIVPLTNASLIQKDIDRYYLTKEGYVCSDLIDSDMTDVEKWILFYIFLLNYKSEGRNNDVIITTKEYISYLLEAQLEEEVILNSLKDIQKYSDLEKIFKQDIFWYITFAKDRQFIDKYKNSSEQDKSMLHAYVINEQKNKKSKDCIGHKFVAGGQMLKSTFLEEAEVLYYTYKISKRKYKDFDDFIDYLLNLYTDLHHIGVDNIIKFIKNHKSIYEDCFNHLNLKEGN